MRHYKLINNSVDNILSWCDNTISSRLGDHKHEIKIIAYPGFSLFLFPTHDIDVAILRTTGRRRR